MSCKHDCPRPPLFPKTIFNPPGMPRIDYRIGRYAEVRAHLFDQLNQAPALSEWTHRGTDDPGIALLEGDAVVIDILTFYQSLYANEAYLRTAQWRQSVGDLVRLGGYRLAPGVGGEATFALTLKGNLPVTVPSGFGLKAQLENIDKPVEFETRQSLAAVPALSVFSLYAPRYTPPLLPGATLLCVADGEVVLKADDRLLLATANPASAVNAGLADPEIVTVDDSWVAFGQRWIRLKSPLMRTTPATALRAYKLGESFRHFGHNAADAIATVSAQGVPSQRATSFRRYANATTTADVEPDLNARQFALDRASNRLQPGDVLLVQGRFAQASTAAGQRFTLARRVLEVENRTLQWGSSSGATVLLTLEQDLLPATGGAAYAYGDVRTLNAMQVTGVAFQVQAAPVRTASASGDELRYYGKSSDAKTLVGRRLLLVQANGEVDERVVQSAALGALQGDAFHTLRLSQPVAYAAFGYDSPTVSVYANVVDASQGKTIDATPIGSGDARQVFQSFLLPKAPLTYLLDATRTPAQTPELELFIDDQRWTRLDTLFNAQPNDRVYVIREDADGNSVVQLGDGKTGARASSGRDNVVARYRVGSAARGVLKPGTKAQAIGKLAQLDKVFLPVEVGIGSGPERTDNARRAAPVRLQSLGRLVSLADYEAEAGMLPNVTLAQARWDAPDGVPAIVMTVLDASGSAAELAAIRDALAVYNRCRGPDRHPIRVMRGYRQYVHLRATVGYDPAHRLETITLAIKHALGVSGNEADGIEGRDGLFGIDQRNFGASLHNSEVIGAVQNVPGVVWVQLLAAAPLALGMPPQQDPLQLALPAHDLIPAPVVACPLRGVLALHARHLVLGFVSATASTECPA